MRIIRSRAVSTETVDSPAAAERLNEIQQQMRDICEPNYDEYYKVTNQRGFIKITVPKRRAVV